jgi:hypothetical protein
MNHCWSQIPTQSLFPLKRLEQTLEIPSPKSVKRIPLYDLYKHRWPIPNMLGEDLKQVSTLIEIDQDIQPLEHVYISSERPGHLCQAFPQIGIVCSRYTEELDTARLEPSYGSHNVVRAEGYVLDSGAVVVVDESATVRRVLCG